VDVTSDDEHAVSTVIAGPSSPKTYATADANSGQAALAVIGGDLLGQRAEPQAQSCIMTPA